MDYLQLSLPDGDGEPADAQGQRWRQATWANDRMVPCQADLPISLSFLLKNKAETLEGQRGTLAARAERCDLGMAIRSWNAFFHKNVNADGD